MTNFHILPSKYAPDIFLICLIRKLIKNDEFKKKRHSPYNKPISNVNNINCSTLPSKINTFPPEIFAPDTGLWFLYQSTPGVH